MNTTSRTRNDSNEGPSITIPRELLLVVFIHGFKGTDETFGSFPQRLQHVLSESIKDSIVECIVFPAYETKGELKEAVERFADWLTVLTIKRENSSGYGNGAGTAKIVLCGHSMGGLLAADTLLGFVHSRPDARAPLWPRIIACITFDTPFLGVHPFVFKNSATSALGYVGAARTVASSVFGAFAGQGVKQASTTQQRPMIASSVSEPSPASQSRWQAWAPAAYVAGGALLMGAAAGAAYQKREDLTTSLSWVTDHLKYVGELWEEKLLKRRVGRLLQVEKELAVSFKNFYTCLPCSPPKHHSPRTFIILPSKSSPVFAHFIPAHNTLASDEVQAHMGMFSAASNDGYYGLGLETAKFIRGAEMIALGNAKIAESESAGVAAVEMTIADAMKEEVQDSVHI